MKHWSIFDKRTGQPDDFFLDPENARAGLDYYVTPSKYEVHDEGEIGPRVLYIAVNRDDGWVEAWIRSSEELDQWREADRDWIDLIPNDYILQETP